MFLSIVVKRFRFVQYLGLSYDLSLRRMQLSSVTYGYVFVGFDTGSRLCTETAY